jgi:hypothetical protein
MVSKWYDQKYEKGGEPSLDDIIELFRQEEIRDPPSSERVIVKKQRITQEAIHALRKNYTRTKDTIALTRLISLGLAIGFDSYKFQESKKAYQSVTKGHNDSSGSYLGFE